MTAPSSCSASRRPKSVSIELTLGAGGGSVKGILDRHPKPDRAGKAAKPQLFFFYSNASGRCRRVEAFLAQVLQARRNHDTFTLHRIEADERPDLIQRFAVEQLPTILVIEGKRVERRLEQPRGCAEIQLLLAPWLR